MITIISIPQFPLGQVVATESALRALSTQEIREGLERHVQADWGDIPPGDAERNIEALHEGSQIFSVYGQGDKRFWVITAVDRSATKVMLPGDYFGKTRSLGRMLPAAQRSGKRSMPLVGTLSAGVHLAVSTAA